MGEFDGKLLHRVMLYTSSTQGAAQSYVKPVLIVMVVLSPVTHLMVEISQVQTPALVQLSPYMWPESVSPGYTVMNGE